MRWWWVWGISWEMLWRLVMNRIEICQVINRVQITYQYSVFCLQMVQQPAEGTMLHSASFKFFGLPLKSGSRVRKKAWLHQCNLWNIILLSSFWKAVVRQVPLYQLLNINCISKGHQCPLYARCFNLAEKSVVWHFIKSLLEVCVHHIACGPQQFWPLSHFFKTLYQIG